MTLSGVARKWIVGKQFPNPDALRDAFITYFIGIHSREGGLTAWAKIALNNGEAIEAFVTRIRPLAERIGKGDPDIQEKVYEIQPEEISEHVELAGGDLAATIETA